MLFIGSATTKCAQRAVCVLMPLFALAQTTTSEQYFRFPANSTFIRLPMRLEANGPYVEAKVNGRGPYNVEVDTGSSTSPLASELAKEMGLDEPGTNANKNTEITLSDGLVVPLRVDFASFGGLWPLTGRHIYGDLDTPFSSISWLNLITKTI